VRERFWERFSLGELNRREWEALCDGCGLCCLLREVEGDQVTVYGIACELLDVDEVRCRDYDNRLRRVPACHQLTPRNVPHYHWLPETCAYRRLHQEKPLPKWHPLLTGDREQMRRRGISVSPDTRTAGSVPRRRMHQHIIASWRG